MDTSETYVKMCEKAFKDIGFIKQPYRPITSQLRNLYCTYALSNNFAFLTQVDAPSIQNQNWWQIYFQDQLQEMSGKNWWDFDVLCMHISKDYTAKHWKHWGMSPYIPYTVKSKEVAGIMAVMKERFGKVWNGEDWLAD